MSGPNNPVFNVCVLVIGVLDDDQGVLTGELRARIFYTTLTPNRARVKATYISWWAGPRGVSLHGCPPIVQDKPSKSNLSAEISEQGQRNFTP